jgi:hypothetical protein
MPQNSSCMTRRKLLVSGLAATAVAGLETPMARPEAASPPFGERRADWIAMLDRVCHPLFTALNDRKLKQVMPVEAYAGEQQHRRQTTYLEALGRALAGIAPWLEHGGDSGPEGELRRQYCEWALAGIASAVDKRSPDYMDFGGDRQTIVDTAFLSLALLRAPNQLVAKLPAAARTQLAEAMRATREQQPPYNNWLLFAAAIEAALHALGEPWDRMRVDYALRQHASWYLGDGVYGDGPQFHQDYYDSFVIHPFLLVLMDSVGPLEPAWAAMADSVRQRAVRYAAIQERMIAADGSYPVVGRSITYRCGAFHLLADMALRQALPKDVAPEQVRGALTAVIRKTLGAAGSFDENGWLRIGLAGHQPSLGEVYISTGSLYLCTAAFLPLGVPAEDRFWSGPQTPWTAVKVWGGSDLAADHAMDGR